MNRRLDAAAFLAAQPKPIRELLSVLRNLVLASAPQATEKVVDGGLLFTCGLNHIKLSAQETYVKLTVGPQSFTDQEQAILSKYSLKHGTYTVQFKPGQNVPEAEISDIVRSRYSDGTAVPTGGARTIDFYDAPEAVLSAEDRDFVLALDMAMRREGYTSDGIQPYACWGKYVISYYRASVKAKRYVARVYLRSDGLLFRMYFSDIDRHTDTIERLPEEIKAAFHSEYGKCKHCSSKTNDSQGNCTHRKTYSLDGVRHEMCDGLVFLFDNHSVQAIPQYIELLQIFYPRKKK